MRYLYIKAPPGFTLHKPPTLASRLRVGLSAVLLTSGVTALTSVTYPMLVYQLEYAPTFKEAIPAAPAPVLAKEPTFVKEMVNTTFDYTNAANWFPQNSTIPAVESASVYTLSIPKLGIKNAEVRNDHTDLKKSLIHYPGTAMPGELGNSVIFGHSVLPQFFSPTNYTSIFSTLHTLQPKDELTINDGQVTYTYHIVEMYSVDPDNLSPLAQAYDRHSLTVITCTPPGTYLKRLIIKAELL